MEMESWRHTWREGFARVFSAEELKALENALVIDDPCLKQGGTTVPPPLLCVEKWPVEAACAVAYCGWQADDLRTVGEVEEFFVKACFLADRLLGTSSACRWFLNWFDETPREIMRTELLAEVRRELENRTNG